MVPKLDSFPESLKKKFENHPEMEIIRFPLFDFEWKALSGIPVKLENFLGNLSTGKLSPIVCQSTI